MKYNSSRDFLRFNAWKLVRVVEHEAGYYVCWTCPICGKFSTNPGMGYATRDLMTRRLIAHYDRAQHSPEKEEMAVVCMLMEGVV